MTRSIRYAFGPTLALTLAAVIVTASPRPLHAATIYFDDFSGSSASALTGTAPDTRPGSELWAATAWAADGSIAAGASGTSHRNAWLPFTPANGKVYELSLIVNPTLGTNTANWFALGFAATGNTTAGFQANPPNAVAWMLQRVNRTDSPNIAVSSFLGPTNTVGQVDHNNISQTGPVELKVILDTQPTLWTVEWFYQGTSIRGPVAFAVNPSIDFVGFGRLATAGGTVDNFLLATVPAPAALAAGLALLAAVVLGRRRA